jgi:hypothetical protein
MSVLSQWVINACHLFPKKMHNIICTRPNLQNIICHSEATKCIRYRMKSALPLLHKSTPPKLLGRLKFVPSRPSFFLPIRKKQHFLIGFPTHGADPCLQGSSPVLLSVCCRPDLNPKVQTRDGSLFTHYEEIYIGLLQTAR